VRHSRGVVGAGGLVYVWRGGGGRVGGRDEAGFKLR